MDVSTRVLDLTRAVVDTLNKQNGMRSAIGDVLQWLARERIDEAEYDYCIGRARALAFPNQAGISIRQQITSSEAKIAQLGGLRMRVSSSIGRWLLFDEDYAYIVTTVAAVMAYHKLPFAAEALCNMILDRGEHHLNGVRYGYSIHRTRLMPVLTKFVDSVALNIVNAGHDLNGLPEQLKIICSHSLNAATYAAVAMVVQRSAGDILITTKRFPGDMVYWLMNHFHGTLEISISGKVLYERTLGGLKTRLIILIPQGCIPGNCRSNNDINHDIRVSVHAGKEFVEVVKEVYGYDPNVGPTNRQPLYSSDVLHHWERGILNKDERNRVRLAAQGMVKWLLQVPITPHGYKIGFQHDDRQQSHGRTLRLEDMMKRFPSIIHRNFGQKASETAIYTGPTMQSPPPSEPTTPATDTMSQYDYEAILASRMPVSKIIDCFPIAAAVFEFVQERCTCSSCGRKAAVGKGKAGCLRETALDELLLLLAHAVADGFGADDVSGMVDFRIQKFAVCELFSDFINEGVLLWDTWFGLAALTYLGGNWSPATFTRSEGSTAIACIQNGSLVATASWLNLNLELTRQEFFGAVFTQGQLSGVCGDFALVQTEKVMYLAEGVPIETEDRANTPEMVDTLATDDCDAYLDTAILGAAGIPYRLLTMVKSAIHRRVVDPAAAIMAIHRSQQVQCSHKRNRYHVPSDPKLKVFTFDQLLGSWNPEDDEYDLDAQDGKDIYVTWLLETPLKFNVAMSLVPHGAIICQGKSCLNCAVISPCIPSGIKSVVCRDGGNESQLVMGGNRKL